MIVFTVFFFSFYLELVFVEILLFFAVFFKIFHYPLYVSVCVWLVFFMVVLYFFY